ncbi:hypothetical protein BGW36DRAFT_390790 [Talaromyces proteolyticus]|uniref:Uncharacterized protein n=1 Tax=Talaromyces proteolyticus TaxID=1131652 RepID=A0AAD4PUI0_9EURO|nr:uncharacterized protein BGW36DRAFT_390790 [Talaromyces proteolyticus]KAH8689400.1 hypothetical protein BGW36DRAFT_390790 [Talaromyces proteolyticus]
MVSIFGCVAGLFLATHVCLLIFYIYTFAVLYLYSCINSVSVSCQKTACLLFPSLRRIATAAF